MPQLTAIVMQKSYLLLKPSTACLCPSGSFNACRRQQMPYSQWLQKHCHFHATICHPRGAVLQLTALSSLEIAQESVHPGAWFSAGTSYPDDCTCNDGAVTCTHIYCSLLSRKKLSGLLTEAIKESVGSNNFER